MKNIFLVFVIVTIILAIVPFAAQAEEVTTPEETSMVEVTEESIAETTTLEEIINATDPPKEPGDKPLENVTDTPTETPTEIPKTTDDGYVITFIDRITEAWENGDINTVLSLAFDVAFLILCFILKKSSGKNKVEVVSALKSSKDTTVEAVNNLIEAANNVITAVEGEDGIKGMISDFTSDIENKVSNIEKLDKEKLEQYGKQLSDCMASQKLLADMLQTVYSNSTTIPMPIKNMINEKYVEICHIQNMEDKNG